MLQSAFLTLAACALRFVTTEKTVLVKLGLELIEGAYHRSHTIVRLLVVLLDSSREILEGGHPIGTSDVQGRAGLNCPGLGRAYEGWGSQICQARPSKRAQAGLGPGRA